MCLGVKVFIDKKAQLTLLGTEMDFVETKLSAEFVFNNPNIKGTCGCGESFSIWTRLRDLVGYLRLNESAASVIFKPRLLSLPNVNIYWIIHGDAEGVDGFQGKMWC